MKRTHSNWNTEFIVLTEEQRSFLENILSIGLYRIIETAYFLDLTIEKSDSDLMAGNHILSKGPLVEVEAFIKQILSQGEYGMTHDIKKLNSLRKYYIRYSKLYLFTMDGKHEMNYPWE